MLRNEQRVHDIDARVATHVAARRSTRADDLPLMAFA